MKALKYMLSLSIAVMTAFVVGGAIFLVFADRPAEYTARVGLLASPAPAGWISTNVISTNVDFSAVASQSMPAIIEVAHSSSVLSKASAAVPGAPSPDDLFDAVSVELVPGSSLARLSVRASSAETARDLVVTIAKAIVDARLLGPAGMLRLLDDEPEVRKVQPDQALAVGLALAAGAAAAMAVLGLIALIRQSKRERIERALTSAGVTRPVAILGRGRHSDVVGEIDLLSTASARPVRVIALSPSSASDAEKLSLELAEAGIRVADSEYDQDAPVVGVTVKGDDSESLSWTVAALPERAQLIAIVFQ